MNSQLQNLVPAPQDPSQRVRAAMNYAIQRGHRWRPLLLIAAYEQFSGKDGSEVIDAACAVELAHCCTIILDDLPFIDNNTSLRRAQLPCHVVHGEAETVYASHLLYALNERLASENALRLHIDEKPVRNEIARLREHLIEAQVLETNLKNGISEVTETSVKHLYKLKSSLFLAAASIAAMLARVQSGQRERLAQFAECLGTAYQVMDDVLDVQGVSSKMGKPTHMDGDKVNLVSQIGVRRSIQFLENQTLQAKETLDSFQGDSFLLRELLDRVVPVTHSLM